MGVEQGTKNVAVDSEHGASRSENHNFVKKATILSKRVIIFTYKHHTCDYYHV